VQSEYTTTIGIECHVQLNTATKLFAAVDNDARDAEPNTLISPLCVGMPGALPVLNSQAVVLAIRAGLALNSGIAEYSKFDRKHYFYPDLPLGYQITQLDQPTILAGIVHAPMSGGRFVDVRIHHAHLEADAGKSTHPEGENYSLVDLNRAGTPLIEIVSEPDMHSAAEAKAFAHELYLLMKYAGVSEANLFYGNMRFDVNVSVSKTTELGTRTETKNLNSFRSIEKAVEYEVSRQIAELEAGNKIVQETRGWNDSTGKTFSQRTKEDAHDYRYFPDPDLPPLVITEAEVEVERAAMSSLPAGLRTKLAVLTLDPSQVEAIIEEPVLARELLCIIDAHDQKTARTIANWYSGELSRQVSESAISWEQVITATPHLAKLVAMLDASQLSSTAAKDLLLDIVSGQKDPLELATERNMLQVSDTGELEVVVAQVLADNQKVADDIRAGGLKAIGFVVGQVMKASGGKANPGVVQQIVKSILGIE
jgi:aspartyl-tRNA(Asn)/glutamyl-tRNA(Gln) amidotransferase subunit B